MQAISLFYFTISLSKGSRSSISEFMTLYFFIIFILKYRKEIFNACSDPKSPSTLLYVTFHKKVTIIVGKSGAKGEKVVNSYLSPLNHLHFLVLILFKSRFYIILERNKTSHILYFKVPKGTIKVRFKNYLI